MDQKSLPTGRDKSIHKLEGKVFWLWWQYGASHKKITGVTNLTIAHFSMYLVTLPIVLVSSIIVKKGFDPSFILWGVLGWLSIFLILSLMMKRHRRHIMEVRASEFYLELRSPLLKTQLPWTDIEDFFDIEHGEFLLECKNGEEYFLSTELTDSNTLFNLINSKRTRSALSFEFSSRLPDGLIDGGIGASFAVLLALVFALRTGGDLITVLVIGSIAAITSWVWWFQVSRITQLVRIGSAGVLVRTRTSTKFMPWNQVTEMKRLGNTSYFVLRSRSEWFLLIASKGEPLQQKLLECQTQYPAIAARKL